MPRRPIPAITEFPVFERDAGPYGITHGPDDALWFNLVHRGRTGQVTAEGRIDEYDLPSPSSEPHGIALGPDGAVWTALEIGTVARLTLR